MNNIIFKSVSCYLIYIIILINPNTVFASCYRGNILQTNNFSLPVDTLLIREEWHYASNCFEYRPMSDHVYNNSPSNRLQYLLPPSLMLLTARHQPGFMLNVSKLRMEYVPQDGWAVFSFGVAF